MGLPQPPDADPPANGSPTPDEQGERTLPDFGKPLPLEELLALAEVDEVDVAQALATWDAYAPNEWKGALG